VHGLWRVRHGKLHGIDELTVASLNLHCGFGFFGRPFDIAGALCQLDADVICVQETWLPVAATAAVAGRPGGGSARADPDPPADSGPAEPGTDGDCLAEAARKLGAVMHRVMMCRPPNLRFAGGSARSGPGELAIGVLATLPVSGYEVIELGVAPGDDVPRFAQAVMLELASGTSVRVVNTHLTHRLTSPLQLRRLQHRLRADAASRRVPTIIAGDLNMPRPFAALSTSYAASVRGKTWPAGRPLVQLDHILAGQGIRVQESGVLPAAGSDHLPVRARLRVLPPG
jgi:endonuclease/exonuclease/phosphatase family metal-dependent hydrolase